MTRDAFIARPGQRPAALVESVRREIVLGRQADLGDWRPPEPSEAGRQRCWREFAGAVNALLEESRHDA